MSLPEGFAMGVAGLFVGIVSVTAGGGATLGVPLLMSLGHDAASAIAIVKFALLASFVTGAWAYRRSGACAYDLPWPVWPLSLLGAVLGANVVLAVGSQTLRIVVLVLLVVVLILGCTRMMGRAEPIACARPQRRGGDTVAVFALGVYSGFLAPVMELF
jgi:uncharacterized membrane protein YfcA